MPNDTKDIDLSGFDEAVKQQPSKAIDLSGFDEAIKKKDGTTSNGTAPNSVNGGSQGQSGSQPNIQGLGGFATQGQAFNSINQLQEQKTYNLPNSGYAAPQRKVQPTQNNGYRWNPVTPQGNPVAKPTNTSSVGDTQQTVDDQLQQQQKKQQEQDKNNAFYGSIIQRSDILNTDTNNPQQVKDKIYDAALQSSKNVLGTTGLPTPEETYSLTKSGIDANLAVLQNQLLSTPKGQQYNALLDKYNKLYQIGNGLIDDYPQIKQKMIDTEEVNESYRNLPPVLKQVAELGAGARNQLLDIAGNIGQAEGNLIGDKQSGQRYKDVLDSYKLKTPEDNDFTQTGIADNASIGLGSMVPFLAAYATGSGEISSVLQTAGVNAGTADVIAGVTANIPLQYNQAYTEAENAGMKSEADKNLYALNSSMLTGMVFSMLPALKTVKGLDEPIANGAKEYAASLAANEGQQTALQKGMAAAKKGLANIAENAGLMASNDFIQKLNNGVQNTISGNTNFDPTIDPKQELKSIITNSLIMAPFGLISGANKWSEQSKLNRESLLYGASNAQQILPELTKLNNEGKITDEQFKNTTKLVTSLSGAWEQLPEDLDIKTKEKVLPLVAQRNHLESAGEKLTPVLAKRNEEQIKIIDNKIDKLVKPKTETDATKEINNQEGVQSERESGNQSGETTETGSSDSVFGEAESGAQDAIKPVNGVITHPESLDSKNGLENSNDSDNKERPNDKLSPEGEAEAKNIDLTNYDKIFVSPNERTVQTVDLANKKPDAEIVQTPLLKTGDISNYEGTKEENFPETAWLNSKDGNEFKDRMEEAYKLKQENPDAAFVTHTKVERALEALDKTDGKWTDKTTKDFLNQKSERPEQQAPSEGEVKIKESEPSINISSEPIAKSESGIDKDGTKIANAVNDAFIEGKFGTEALDKVMGKLDDTDTKAIYDKVKEKINTGIIEPKKVVERILTTKQGSEQDQATLLYQLAHLKGEETELQKAIINEDNEGKKRELQNNLIDVQNSMMDNALANRMLGRTASSIFRLRQLWVNRDMSLDDMQQQYMASKGIKELTKEQSEYVRSAYNALRESKVKLGNAREELEKAREENERLLSDNEKLKALKDKFINQKKAERHTKNEEILSKSKERLSKAKEELKKLRGNFNSGFDPKVAIEIGKIAAEKVYQGVVKFDELIKNILDEVKDVFPNWTKDDVVRHLLVTKNKDGELSPSSAAEQYIASKYNLDKSNSAIRDKVKAYDIAHREYALKQYEWQKERRNDIMENRSAKEKIVDSILRWQRFSVLSYPSTIAKLAAVVGQQLLFKPLKFGLQKLIYHAFDLPKKFSGGELKNPLDKATIWGNPDWSSIGKYYSEFVRNFALANLQEHFKGIDTKELLYGNSFMYDEFNAASGILDMPGRTHGYMKSFIKNPEFKYAQEQIVTNYISKMGDIQKEMDNPYLAEEHKQSLEDEYNKYDVTNEDVMERVNKLSLEHGKWAILMNDNKFVEKLNKFTNDTGIAGALIKSEFPVLKIPLNYVGRAFATKYGLIQAVIGKGKDTMPSIMRLAIQGTKDLTPEQANLLGRTVTLGSMGAAFFMLGYMNKDNIKENEDGSYSLGGMTIDKNLVHSPELESVFSGVHTAQKFEDEEMDDKNMYKWIKDFGESDLEIMAKAPFTSMLTYGFLPRAAMSLNNKDKDKVGENMENAVFKKISDMATPGFVKQTATALDKDSEGNTVKRKPEGDELERFWQTLELRIPKLREKVPESE